MLSKCHHQVLHNDSLPAQDFRIEIRKAWRPAVGDSPVIGACLTWRAYPFPPRGLSRGPNARDQGFTGAPSRRGPARRFGVLVGERTAIHAVNDYHSRRE